MNIEFKEQPDYLEFIVSGEYSFPQVFSLIDRAHAEGTKHHCTNILADIHQMTGEPEEFERFLIGRRVAEVLRAPFKILAIAKETIINKFTENTAINRGAIILVTSDRRSGISWLLGKEQEAPVLRK